MSIMGSKACLCVYVIVYLCENVASNTFQLDFSMNNFQFNLLIAYWIIAYCLWL